MTPDEKLAAEKAAEEAAKRTAGKVPVSTTPKGKGKFADVVTVKTTAKHPTMPAGKEYKVHSGQVKYLVEKGYIVKPVEPAESV